MKLKQLQILLFLVTAALTPTGLLAQETVITGSVTDRESSEILPGASIVIKGSNVATISDKDGAFSIQVPSPKTILVFSYIGYVTREIEAGNGPLTVALTSDDKGLEEVIIVGYGTEKRSRINSAIVAVDMKEVEDLPVGNLGAAMAGRLLGVSVSGGMARPGSAAQLVVRNPTSLAKDGGNNNPLYVIDDIIQVGTDGRSDPSLFNSLDPSEVESITILKDANAAIYGSRGANGVVLVKTKRGTIGKPRITYSGSYAINDEAYRTKMMSAYDLARYINIVNGPNGANQTSSPQDYFFSDDELAHFRTINHDWLDQAWKPASNTRHAINVSGGAERATYFASVAYYGQTGNIGRLDYDKWTYRAGADVNVLTGLKVGLQVSGNQQDEKKINSKIGGENEENDYINLLMAPRYVPTYIDGLPVRLPGSGNNLSGYHFFELEKLNNHTEYVENTLTINAYAEYDVPFLKGLKLRGSYARNARTSSDWRIGSPFTLYNFTRQGENGHIYEGAANPVAVRLQNDNRVRFSYVENRLVQYNFTVNYGTNFGLHSLDAFATVERSEVTSKQGDAWKEAPLSFTNGQFNTAFGAIDGRTFAYEAGNLGYVGRLSYGYSNRYSASLMVRSDASTKFAPENYWGTFFSVGLGWEISNEKFFKSAFTDYLKLRYSVGLLGKDDTQRWQWRQRYTFQNGQGAVFGNDNTPAGIGMKMEISPNRAVTWSDELKHNAGIDARFLNNRLSLSLDGFYNVGRNMLIEKTGNVPVTVGGSIASQNWAAMDFFGYEIGLGWNDQTGRGFHYGVDLRFSWADNKVHQGNFNDQDIKYPWNPKPGESGDNGKWGYEYLGMFKTQEAIDTYIAEYGITQMHGVNASDFKPGMLYYADIRGSLQADGTFAGPDGIIDNNDQVQLVRKSSNRYGFGTTLKAGYKGLSLNVVIAGSFGGWAEIDARGVLQRNIQSLFQNGPAYWSGIYDPELNPDGQYPNPFWGAVSTTPVSQFWQVSAFRMRVVNANLTYTLPKTWSEAVKMSSARIVLSALNPLNLYNPYTYKDSQGSWNTYPVLKTFSLGVNASF